jgi:hypothetical protein
MKIFILEDDDYRMVTLEKLDAMKGAEITRIVSCAEVEKFQPPYDLILLDHDLGGRQLEEHEDNGLAFVKLIKDKIPAGSRVIVHSYNYDGAMNMITVLAADADPDIDIHYEPFMGLGFINRLKAFRDRFYAGKLGNHLD